jgi:hypothetical protein
MYSEGSGQLAGIFQILPVVRDSFSASIAVIGTPWRKANSRPTSASVG